MGIKHFFGWFKNNFKESMTEISHTEDFRKYNIHIDNLALDLNGIFHNCAQQVYQYGEYKRKSLITKQYRRNFGVKKQIELFAKICEKIEFYRRMVRPKKRLILCVDGVAGTGKMSQQRQRRFKSSQGEKLEFDPNCITPGTKFMDYLTKYIDWYIRVMVSNSMEWKNLEIVFSNEKAPGEGEHKIISYFRNFGDNTESFCIQGMDADLLMLSLGVEIEKLYVLRENHYNHSQLYIIDIQKFSDDLSEYLQWKEGNSKFNKINAINDFIFICFLVGNDFLPQMPSIEIIEGGIDRMIEVYKDICSNGTQMTRYSRPKRSMTFKLKSLENFLCTLASQEKESLEEKINKKESFFTDELLNKNTIENVEGLTVNLENYKKDYYTNNFPKDVSINEICQKYLEGMQWVITYYKIGIPDWQWYYPYHYAPFASDLAKYCQKFKNLKYNENNPVNPFIQLISVLPPQSSNLLPSPLDTLVNSEKSPLSEFFPEKFETDLSGKRQEWEGIVKIPMVDIIKVKEEYDKKIDQVDPREVKRCLLGKSLVYRVSDNNFGYSFPSFYGNINKCLAKINTINL